MGRKPSPSKPKANFTLGGEQAEADPLLPNGFFPSGQYLTLASKTDPGCFIVGRTGSGKSAILQQIEEENPEHTVRISPEDLSLPYITDLGVIRNLSQLDVHLDPLFIALWKHVFLVEIIKHRYKISTPVAKNNFITNLRDRIKGDRSKAAALDYLEEFEGKFWCETDERVRDITERFEKQIEAATDGSLKIPGTAGVKAKASASGSHASEIKSQQAERFQRIVNETQLPRLNKMISVLDDDILDSPQNFTFIVIDDLDRDWIDEAVANTLIRCLFRAVIDLKRVRNLKILVGLRTNIFEALDFGSKTGGQEEKFRSLTVKMRWSPTELETLLSERTKAAAEALDQEGITSIKSVLPATNRTRGNPLSFILRRTLMRPRDAIAYFNECFKLSHGKPRVTWDSIHGAELPYSENRLLALRDEWKPNYPGIYDVIQAFSSTPVHLTEADLTKIFENIALLPMSGDFEGSDWLTPLTETIWKGDETSSWSELYHPIIQMLFRIGFIGIKSPQRSEAVFNSEDPTYADLVSNVSKSVGFYVHPAYRRVLDIQHPDTKAG